MFHPHANEKVPLPNPYLSVARAPKHPRLSIQKRKTEIGNRKLAYDAAFPPPPSAVITPMAVWDWAAITSRAIPSKTGQSAQALNLSTSKPSRLSTTAPHPPSTGTSPKNLTPNSAAITLPPPFENTLVTTPQH